MWSVYLLIFVQISLMCTSVWSSDIHPDYRAVDSANVNNAFQGEVHLGESMDWTHARSKRQSGNDTGTTTAQPDMPAPTTTPTQTPAETTIVMDQHRYYNSTFYPSGANYFIDLQTDDRTVVLHEALSATHLTAGEVGLPFMFPFYGHNISRVYIATGGFLSLSTFFHQYLSITQYIAPIMGNFDPSLNGSSQIRYAYNSTSFTVEWDNIHIQHLQSAGRFTFQTTLFIDGRILFAYKTVPISVDSIGGGNNHKVTVGLSDGYYIDEPLYPGSILVRRTIYYYHKLELNRSLVTNRSAYVLTPLPTCNLFDNCGDCLAMRDNIQFDCAWCQQIRRCSSGIDRHRQSWLEADCPDDAQSTCPTSNSTAVVIIIVVLIVVITIACIFGILFFAYRNPSTRAGQYLIGFQQRIRHGIRRNPQDDYGESIVNNMQESKPSGPPVGGGPPAYTVEAPPMTAPITPPAAMGGAPAVITSTATPGANMAGNGDAHVDDHAKTAEV